MKNEKASSWLSDYHMHTPLCKHAVMEPLDYKEAASSQKINEICFADHAPNPTGYDPKHRMEMGQFGQYRDMVSQAQNDKIPTVLLGIEADYYEGCEDFLKEWLPAQDFDLVLGSVHFIEGWGFDNPEERHIWDSVDVTATWREYFKLVGRLAETGLFDSVGHIDLPKKFGYRPSDNDLKEMVQPALDSIAQAGMGIELNTSGLRKPVREIYPSPLVLSLAHDRDIPICFGSDAHRPQEVGAGFPEALRLAREAGYTYYFRIEKRQKKLQSLRDIHL